MKANTLRRVAIVMAMVVMTVVGSKAEAAKEDEESSMKSCYADCYPKCDVAKPLWCATLCVGKCKHGKSIPDNLCQCTYSCSKFRCADVGSDPEKVRRCVHRCSSLCNIKY
ncbi:hypothetical protein L6164_021561 [Bauhinia variegata]|uniref:Uncharacterized protein n=1 Tax=Bauhinia variegata TaxID=167791 RepID=A0ACB9MYJ5_BAUVA|nr:hypothetical protein L6164_021561 [Bauhinia variegata]